LLCSEKSEIFDFSEHIDYFCKKNSIKMKRKILEALVEWKNMAQ